MIKRSESIDISDRILKTLESVNRTRASPEFIIRLVQLISEPETEISLIARLIEREPNVSAYLLKLANSAFFSRGMIITSVSQSIVHLGLNVVKKIVVAFEMFDLFPVKNDFPFFDDATFLKNCIAGALIADEISRRLNLKEKGEGYTCALLRDYGVLILKQYFPDVFKRIFEMSQEKQCPFGVSCAMICGYDHRHISSILFSNWNLPSNICSVLDQGMSRYGVWVLIDRILDLVDSILKQHNYAQWDPFCTPSQCGIDFFSLNGEEFNASVMKILWEVDESMLLLSTYGLNVKAA